MWWCFIDSIYFDRTQSSKNMKSLCNSIPKLWKIYWASLWLYIQLWVVIKGFFQTQSIWLLSKLATGYGQEQLICVWDSRSKKLNLWLLPKESMLKVNFDALPKWSITFINLCSYEEISSNYERKEENKIPFKLKWWKKENVWWVCFDCVGKNLLLMLSSCRVLLTPFHFQSWSSLILPFCHLVRKFCLSTQNWSRL